MCYAAKAYLRRLPERSALQILVVVASTLVAILGCEADKGSMSTVVEHGGIGPKSHTIASVIVVEHVVTRVCVVAVLFGKGSHVSHDVWSEALTSIARVERDVRWVSVPVRCTQQ